MTRGEAVYHALRMERPERPGVIRLLRELLAESYGMDVPEEEPVEPLILLGSQSPSQWQRAPRKPRGPWTAEHRERFNATIAARRKNNA